MIGRFTTGSSGLGWLAVMGRSRVPSPPAITTAFTTDAAPSSDQVPYLREVQQRRPPVQGDAPDGEGPADDRGRPRPRSRCARRGTARETRTSGTKWPPCRQNSPGARRSRCGAAARAARAPRTPPAPAIAPNSHHGMIPRTASAMIVAAMYSRSAAGSSSCAEPARWLSIRASFPSSQSLIPAKPEHAPPRSGRGRGPRPEDQPQEHGNAEQPGGAQRVRPGNDPVSHALILSGTRSRRTTG